MSEIVQFHSKSVRADRARGARGAVPAGDRNLSSIASEAL